MYSSIKKYAEEIVDTLDITEKEKSDLSRVDLHLTM
jgi:hypothetical protein